ncbi:MAG: hypothetical protein QM766_15165 [Burkholderiaceae bacterium]
MSRPRATRNDPRRTPERVLSDRVGIAVLLLCLLVLMFAGH